MRQIKGWLIRCIDLVTSQKIFEFEDCHTLSHYWKYWTKGGLSPGTGWKMSLLLARSTFVTTDFHLIALSVSTHPVSTLCHTEAERKRWGSLRLRQIESDKFANSEEVSNTHHCFVLVFLHIVHHISIQQPKPDSVRPNVMGSVIIFHKNLVSRVNLWELQQRFAQKWSL